MRQTSPKEALLNYRRERTKFLKILDVETAMSKAKYPMGIITLDLTEKQFYKRALLDEQVKEDDVHVVPRP